MSEQIPFTISTKAAPEGPHGVPPSDVNAAIVAEQDKSLTTKVGERVEQLRDSAQPVIQPVVNAAQPYVQAAADAVASVAQASKEAVVSGAASLGLTQTSPSSTAPHGVPPTDTNPSGVVADQDKSLITRASESVQPVVNAAQPYIQPVVNAASGAVNAASGAVVSGAQAASGAVVSGAAALGITNPSASSTGTPTGPHGVPPSEAGPGVVAQEDKSLITRASESVQPVIQAAQPYIQPVVNAASGAVSAASGAVVNGAQAASGAVVSGAAALGITNPPPSTGPPSGPHGVPPSEAGTGVVAQEDKTLTTRFVEGAQPVIQPVVNAAQVVVDYANKASEAVGQQFVNIGQQVGELRDVTQDTLHNAEKKVGLGVHVTPGVKPEPPHGVPPTNYNPGLVSSQDKSIPQVVGEKLADVKDQAVAQVNTAVGAASSTLSTAQQQATEIKDQAVAQVSSTVNTAVNTTSAVIGEAERQAGLGVHVTPGVTPQAPHGVAPTNYNPGLVSSQDKTVVQVAGERIADARDQAVQKVEEVRKQAGV